MSPTQLVSKTAPIDCDVLYDLPGVLTVARLYYVTHTDYEVTVFEAAELEDLASLNALLPANVVRISSESVEAEGLPAIVTTYRANEV